MCDLHVSNHPSHGCPLTFWVGRLSCLSVSLSLSQFLLIVFWFFLGFHYVTSETNPQRSLFAEGFISPGSEGMLFHVGIVLCLLWSSGQWLCWHASMVRSTTFPGSCIPPCVCLSMPCPLFCGLLWQWRDQFTLQQLKQASFVSGLPSVK